MNTLAQNQKVVKGLSIAAIVISALAIVFSLVMVFTGFGHARLCERDY